MIVSAQGLPDRFSRWRRDVPAALRRRLRPGGGGHRPRQRRPHRRGRLRSPRAVCSRGRPSCRALFTLLKFCATWLSAWSGVPAGVFAPSLTIGAGIGHDVALLTGVSREAAIPLIALGMVGFLAATTQGPITAFIIVMEMVSGHTWCSA
jgi:H+/Cl- antiporter ClcA